MSSAWHPAVAQWMVLINIGLVPGWGICRWINCEPVLGKHILWNLLFLSSRCRGSRRLGRKCSGPVLWELPTPPGSRAPSPEIAGPGPGGTNPLSPVGHRCPRPTHWGHRGLHDRAGEEECVWSLVLQGPGHLGKTEARGLPPGLQVSKCWGRRVPERSWLCCRPSPCSAQVTRANRLLAPGSW